MNKLALTWLLLCCSLAVAQVTNPPVGGGGSGTVTSVGLTAPTGFTITGSPVTTTGNLGFTYTAHAVALPLICEAASASGTAYTCTTSPSFTPADGDTVLFESDVANTGSSTLAVNGATAGTIKKQGGSANLVANDMLANKWTLMTFESAAGVWQMLSPTDAAGGSGTVTSIATTAPITGGTITGTGTIACATCVVTNASNTITTGTQDLTGATATKVSTVSAGDSSTNAASTAFVATAVTNAIAAVNPAVAVQATSAAVLPNSPTYSNGVAGIGATLTTATTNTSLVVDGYTPVLNDRILVKNQASTFQNGVYLVTQVSGVGVAWILTRALDYDQPSDMNNTGAIPVVNGTVNAQTQWLQTSSVATIGTDAVTFTQFALNPSNIVTATSPGVGIAHFAGSTQAVTSSAVDLSGADATGTLAAGREPAHTGNVTNSAGSLALTIGAAQVTEAMHVFADNTTGNVSTSAHGFTPKLDNVATHFLNGTGAYSAPVAGTALLSLWSPVSTAQAATHYFSFTAAATVAAADILLPFTGTISEMYCASISPPASGQTIAFTAYYDDATTTTATCTITGTAQTCSVTGLSVAVTSGHKIAIQEIQSATTGSIIPRCDVKITGAS
jgi:hypothetical protein